MTNDIENNAHALSGILINDISDHKMVFTFQENNKYHEEYSRFVEIVKRDEISIQKFITELKNQNISNHLNSSINNNPHENYKIFASLLQHAREKHKKMVKYNKKKHKKCIWMTNGLLTSINTKDNLYKILMQTDTTNVELFNILKEEFKVYRATLRKGIREAKRMYYRRTFHL